VSNNHSQPLKEWGLLANGSSGEWSIDIDESADGKLNMQIDGPLAFLSFTIDHADVASRLCSYLQSGLHREEPKKPEGVKLGHFVGHGVSVIQDDECATRWFLVIGGETAVVRLTLDASVVGKLVDALGQIISDLDG
jgi:hypothetical protein